MMLGQLKEDQNDVDTARSVYKNGLIKCEKSVPLWLLYSRLELRFDSVVRARSVLESARKKVPDSDVIYLESIRLERSAGDEQRANYLISKGRQQCPMSGPLWDEYIGSSPKVQRQRIISDALKKQNDEPFIIMAAGKLLWQLGKYEKARGWIERAVRLKPEIGDFWAVFYFFELTHGTESSQQKVVSECVSAHPVYGEIWCSVSKQKENRRKSVDEILKIVTNAVKTKVLSDTNT